MGVHGIPQKTGESLDPEVTVDRTFTCSLREGDGKKGCVCGFTGRKLASTDGVLKNLREQSLRSCSAFYQIYNFRSLMEP